MRVLCTIDEVVNTSMYSSESNLKITKEYSGADRNTVLFSPKVIYPVLIGNVLYGVRCFSTYRLYETQGFDFCTNLIRPVSYACLQK